MKPAPLCRSTRTRSQWSERRGSNVPKKRTGPTRPGNPSPTARGRRPLCSAFREIRATRACPPTRRRSFRRTATGVALGARRSSVTMLESRSSGGSGSPSSTTRHGGRFRDSRRQEAQDEHQWIDEAQAPRERPVPVRPHRSGQWPTMWEEGHWCATWLHAQATWSDLGPRSTTS